MDNLQKSIIRTVAFYDAVGGIALSKLELYKYLLNPNNPTSFISVCDKLDRDWRSLEPYISRYRGFYFLRKNKFGYEKRIEIGKSSIKKRKIAEKMARLISFLPYVKMIALTGSLSHHSANSKSDIDILIVAKGGHIWTSRMLVSALTHILGKRRHGNKIKDRICLNHYISDANLSLRPNNLFSAHIGASLVPLWGDKTTYALFVKTNSGLINSRFPNYKAPHLYSANHALHFSKNKEGLSEWTGAKINFWFSVFEPFFRGIQLKKIRHNFKKAKIESDKTMGGLFDDGTLVFHHPRPIRQEALFLYKKNLKELDL